MEPDTNHLSLPEPSENLIPLEPTNFYLSLSVQSLPLLETTDINLLLPYSSLLAQLQDLMQLLLKIADTNLPLSYSSLVQSPALLDSTYANFSNNLSFLTNFSNDHQLSIESEQRSLEERDNEIGFLIQI
ncbi:9668_t:CDS:2 [Dentiscutata erythropus]|uniref:9668_t:CDS:1 n=1 Tax=Dentiscutata erythropus TaxID=1348616 RepID=A0A9N8WKK3_9GLOM|nr:9668_t:CDS:2 [Dentiscutata erythropus]